ncbi:MAG: hypothetical protein R3A48_22800 [Polyangiales bacterium]
MYQPMIPCTACARHVRASEARCPFCDATLSIEARSALAPDTTRRLSRAAAFAFGLSVAGCSSTVGGTDAAADTVTTDTVASDSVVPDTGSRPDTAVATDRGGGTDAVTPQDVTAPEDLGNIAPPYGIPADAGGPPDDDGGAAAEYGAPPMDAGVVDDGGGIFPLYGLSADV